MERHLDRELEILSAVGEGGATSQRALAARMGVALGLVNLYLKRLAHKGYIKVTEFPGKPYARKRLTYLLTPKGIAAKSRLTYAYMDRSLAQYRLARQTLREALVDLARQGKKRVALYGTGEAAELAYLTLREFGLEPVGVFAGPSATFLGEPARDYRDLANEDLDAVVIATFDRPHLHTPALVALGLPAEKLVMLRPSPREHGSR